MYTKNRSFLSGKIIIGYEATHLIMKPNQKWT